VGYTYRRQEIIHVIKRSSKGTESQSNEKGEIDHVGGTAKVSVRRMAATGQTFHYS